MQKPNAILSVRTAHMTVDITGYIEQSTERFWKFSFMSISQSVNHSSDTVCWL